MNTLRIFITGTGIISPLGQGPDRTMDMVRSNKSGIGPLSLFPVARGNPLPVGQVSVPVGNTAVPRSHALALMAARDALSAAPGPVDAIILGTTTGGMAVTEELLKKKERDPELFAYHSTGSIAEYCAAELACPGPVITVSTACSSGTAAITLALELLRSGAAKRVLAGGVDSLCRLTYYGFNSLQLIDPLGARPFDRDRKGMSVAEGAAMLVLTASGTAPVNAIAEVAGAGLSCDAHHPAAPHPEGEGALRAMESALLDAGMRIGDIDYINLHGTGTRENDLSEAKAVRALFGDAYPPLSSVKGATGHSLAAAGAIEAVLCCYAIKESIVPGNTGFVNQDPDISIKPVIESRSGEVKAVLSNSFGFGGNNASIILTRPGAAAGGAVRPEKAFFEIKGSSCVTGAGSLAKTMERLKAGAGCGGILPLEVLSENLPFRTIRRLKRLPRMALSLAVAAHEQSGLEAAPGSICFGTAWGALSETYDFLEKLFETNEEFTSPTDFVGSVHNAPAGQVAMWFKSKGPNMTVTGGDYSFEQALMTAGLVSRTGDSLFVIGADEHHAVLSDIFDRSAAAHSEKSDGGGALYCERKDSPSGLSLCLSFYQKGRNNAPVMEQLIRSLGGAERIRERCAAIFAGLPTGTGSEVKDQLDGFMTFSGYAGPVIDYRTLTGHHGSASAAACAIASEFVRGGTIPGALWRGADIDLQGRRVLVLGFGHYITAMELWKE